MRYLLNFFWICFSRRIRSVKSWLVLLLIPLLIAGIRIALPDEQVSAPVQVGVALPEEGADALWDLLDARSGTVLTFIQADTDTIDRNIAAGRWDCGVIVSDDFAQRLEELDTDRLFTIRVGKGSSVYPLVQETVASCMASLVTVPLAEKYLTTSGIAQDTNLPEKLEKILDTTEQVNITMSTADGASLERFDLSSRGVSQVLCWVVGITILVWLLLCTFDLGLWCRTGAAKRMLPLQSATSLMCAHMAADGLIAILSGCTCMLILGRGLAGCTAVIGYTVFWSSLGILLAHFAPLWQSIPVLPPFAVVTSLLLSGALVDAAALIPALDHILPWIPGRIFLRICQGDPLNTLPLIFAAAIFLLAAGITDKIKKRCA